jgi:DNA (cytosine-5)-methyltransferase 1
VIKPYRLLDLFAGCGGFTQGFVGSGRYTSVAAVELDPDAADTYRSNFGDHVHQGDIGAWLETSPLPAADVVIGGPPCQGFSKLNRSRTNDPRNKLWDHYVETISRVRPYAFALENVPDFLLSEQFLELQEETRAGGRLESYALEHWILNASHYGVAQRRRRAMVIGRLKELPSLGEPVRTTDSAPRTVADVLSGVEPAVSDVELPRRRGPYTMAELHLTRAVKPISAARFRRIPPGGNRFDIPDEMLSPCWRKHKTGSMDVMGRLHWDRPAVTIRTEFYKPEKGRYLHPEEHRPITHYEAALIQGFPADFTWHGSKTSIGRQIGNAVPIPLGAVIGGHIADALDARVIRSETEEAAAADAA